MISSTSQHCCSLHAWLTCLYHAEGNYAVIIHSDKECSALIPDMIDAVPDERSRFFCTNLSEQELVSGHGSNKLERCISWVVQERAPSLIIVLSSCPAVLVGEDLEGLCRKAQKKFGTDIEFVRTSGFSLFEPKHVMDECLALLLTIPGVISPRKWNKGVVLVGFNTSGHHPRGYAQLKKEVRLLAGIQVLGCMSSFMSIDELMRCTAARNICTIDRSYYRKSVAVLSERSGIGNCELPYPVSPATTVGFMQALVSLFGTESVRSKKMIAAYEKRSQAVVQRARKKIKGMRLFYGIASALDYSVVTSAHEGLCFLPFFQELGLDITLLVQGNPEKHEEVVRLLRSEGAEHPVRVFGHCGDAYTFLPQGEKVLVFGSDMLKEQVERAGHLFFDMHDMAIGFAGIEMNLQRLKDIGAFR